MDAADWDARYAGSPLVWSAGPNRWVRETFTDRTPGHALDLGAGEGRHALWLAGRGWDVTAVDFSAEAIRKARSLQAENAPGTLGRIAWVRADVLTYRHPPRTCAAVLALYLHLPAAERRTVLRAAAEALAPGGTLLVVGHDRTNPAEGVGGPSDLAVLFTAEDVVADLGALPGLEVRRAERARRPVGDGVALDALVEVVRTA